MSPEERRDHCRAIAASGGQSTVRKYGFAHMAEIGKVGFRVAVELGWGTELARKLAPSYTAKFGRAIHLGPTSQRKAELRRQARAIYGGALCDVSGCGAVGEVHHMAGLVAGDPNDPAVISILCAEHHRAEHRALRRARRLAREGANQ